MCNKMDLKDDDLLNEQDDHSAQQKQQPTGYRADDGDGTEEKSLKRNPLFGAGQMQHVHEGQPMGGHNFNKDGNPTPLGDDKDNPSRNAGYTNAYFARTEPLHEDTANNNFKAPDQQGEPDYDKAQPYENITSSKTDDEREHIET